jgi:SAM-dependent methyltransferase
LDIMNRMSAARFAELDDLLAFISIYDDQRRTAAWRRMLRSERQKIKGQVCVDGGCGLGLFSAELARLGAARVYAVEANKALYELARERLAAFPCVQVIHEDLAEFRPREHVQVLVHEFFGQLLYDEDLMVLSRLRFKPRYFLPDGAVLMAGVRDAAPLLDKNVTRQALQCMQGGLISGLFEDRRLAFHFPVIDWSARRFLNHAVCDISAVTGDVLYFGLQVNHQKKLLCQAGRCENWSVVWTPRGGDRFRLDFLPDRRGMQVQFEWI